ncbi:MAG: beta-propeller domain-containing protein [Verrucomicrobiae bacterium]|nr:beta-propeller domain-containing protein [Verrucomicrobiae bacterium]
MKTFSRFGWKPGFLGSLVLAVFATLVRADLPVIESIHVEHTNLVVTARVPAGHVRVTLESREALGSGAWVPVAVRRLSGQGGVITFNVPRTGAFAVLRVRADASEELPAAFYSGTDQFLPQPSSATRDMLTFFGPDSPTDSTSEAREVVESDIWRLDGDTLYFFNQHRGLQIIDVSEPDHAALRGTLNLPAAGEQMYLLRSNHVVLLTRNNCATTSGYSDSEVLIVAVNDGAPFVAARLAVTGTISESRLVGEALYVAAQSLRSQPGSDGSVWEWGTEISSFDLAVPESPVARSTLWYAGYNNVVYATDTYFFAVTQDPTNYQQSRVNVIDITAPEGTMRAYDTIIPAGRVDDKFKLNWTDGIFTAISEVSSNPRLTKLETFRLPDSHTVPPYTYLKLGEVEVGHGERLFATRFDYPRAYIVTFLQIDPLWVVDLSDPANPKVSGELEVPGWSTYIHPRGDQLVAVGIETNLTTVSLFDVADPSRPSLLSRVPIGSHYSSSEANRDEKAFSVIEEAGLILLPIQGYTSNGWQAWVQLIDLGVDSLTARGVIAHDFAPRRATLHRDRVVSLSGVELLSVDATDRDQPQLTGRLELAWPINRVFIAGDYLIELTTGSFGNGYLLNTWQTALLTEPVVRVAPAEQPDTVLTILKLTNAPIAGATVRDNRLYLAQAIAGGLIVADGTTNSPPPPTLWLTVVDLSNLPTLTILGETAIATTQLGWNNALEPVWPKPDLLVWVGGGNDFRWWGPWDWFGGPGLVRDWFWPYSQSSGGGRLFTFDVSNDVAPVFLSEVDLTTNGWWSFSKPFAADGRIYLSHQTFVEITATNGNPYGDFVEWPTAYQRTFLDVVDYADAHHPTVRKPVSLPGTLQGISHQGALLYTVGSHHTSSDYYSGHEALAASAYDGVAAHLVDSLSLSNVYPHPVLVSGTNIFLGRAQGYYPATDLPSPALETWTLSSAGRFTNLGSVKLPGAASDLVSFPGLLAAQLDWSRVVVFDRSDPAALRQVGEGPTSGCLYLDLQHADAQPARALWLPLDSYGVTSIQLSP